MTALTVSSNTPDVIISPSDKFSKTVDVPTSLSLGVPDKAKSETLNHDGPDEIEILNSLAELSISSTSKVKSYAISSSTESKSEVINTGASFTGLTVILTVASMSESSSPSFALNVKLSEPL